MRDLGLLVRHRRYMWEAISDHPVVTLDVADSVYRRWARVRMRSNRFAGFIVEVGGVPAASGCVWLMPAQPRPRASRDDGRLPPVDVHGAEPTRKGTCRPDRARGDALGAVPRRHRHDVTCVRLRRIGVSSTWFRADPRNALHPLAPVAGSDPSHAETEGSGREMSLPSGTHASVHIRP
jgi:hypothetical protein